MLELKREFKLVKGQGTTKRNDYILKFGIFKIKELANTKDNRAKAEQRGSMFYLVDTQKTFNNNRVSSVFWQGKEIFYFDTNTEKNCNDYLKGFYKGIIKNGIVQVLEIEKSEFLEVKKLVQI